jgi:hypothetical protein
MTDQIVFYQRKDHVREKSQHVLSVTFRDRTTVANVTPTNIRYRIDDLTNCATILDWTAVSPDDEITLTITPTQNELQSQCNREEKRQVTVAADYGLSSQFMDSVCFDVENIRGVV